MFDHCSSIMFRCVFGSDSSSTDGRRGWGHYKRVMRKATGYNKEYIRNLKYSAGIILFFDVAGYFIPGVKGLQTMV